MTFTEYIMEQENKADNAKGVNIEHSDVGIDDIDYQMRSANPKTWTCKIVGGEKYLLWQNKYLNVTKLKNAISVLYTAKGHIGHGFSKLAEEDLVRYTVVKEILKKLFIQEVRGVLDPKQVAQYLYYHENFEFKNY